MTTAESKTPALKESIVDTVVRESYRTGPYRNALFEDRILTCVECHSELIHLAGNGTIICGCCFASWKDRRLASYAKRGLA